MVTLRPASPTSCLTRAWSDNSVYRSDQEQISDSNRCADQGRHKHKQERLPAVPRFCRANLANSGSRLLFCAGPKVH
jgi:hypothetical protein